jgi:hypothetical protein
VGVVTLGKKPSANTHQTLQHNLEGMVQLAYWDVEGIGQERIIVLRGS